MSSVHKIKLKNKKQNIYYQNNKKIFLELVKLINENPHKYAKKILSKCTRKEYKDYSHLRIWIDSMLPQLQNYNYATKCYWIIYGIQDFPKCANEKCNNKITQQLYSFWKGINKYCCNKCQITSNNFKIQRKKTWNKNLGVDYPTQSKQVIKVRHINNKRKYGVNEPIQNKEILENTIKNRRKKYNGKWESESSKKQREQTNLRRYGHKCNLHSPKCEKQIKRKWKNKYKNGHPLSDPKVRELGKQTCLINYGVDCYSKSDEYKKLWKNDQWKNNSISKQHETKRHNKSFKQSKLEDAAYQLLINTYSINNVQRQFNSEKYPFLCDFYITSKDMYIECNFHWTHGGKHFDSNCQSDLNKLEYWKSKHTKYYDNAINTWTIRDVQKFNVAFSNNLNYKCFYSMKELKDFLINENIF